MHFGRDITIYLQSAALWCSARTGYFPLSRLYESVVIGVVEIPVTPRDCGELLHTHVFIWVISFSSGSRACRVSQLDLRLLSYMQISIAMEFLVLILSEVGSHDPFSRLGLALIWLLSQLSVKFFAAL
jgi:hypothetical protein